MASGGGEADSAAGGGAKAACGGGADGSEAGGGAGWDDGGEAEGRGARAVVSTGAGVEAWSGGPTGSAGWEST